MSTAPNDALHGQQGEQQDQADTAAHESWESWDDAMLCAIGALVASLRLGELPRAQHDWDAFEREELVQAPEHIRTKLNGDVLAATRILALAAEIQAALDAGEEHAALAIIEELRLFVDDYAPEVAGEEEVDVCSGFQGRIEASRIVARRARRAHEGDPR